ncbi:MAG: LptA/OstA family protein [bacterium]
MKLNSLICSFLLGLIVVYCAVQAENQPIVLKQADFMRTEQGINGPVRYLDGNVWITHDTLSITCEHAIYEESVGRLTFHDKVHFVEPERQIWADRATYYEKDGRANAEGNVRIEQDSTLITCQRVTYLEAREEALFWGDVIIHSLRENAVLTGNHGAYKRPNERGIISQNPRLVRTFEEDDSLVVIGRVIEYQFASREAVVTDCVLVVRGDFQAKGDKLFYDEASEHARLIGNPVLENKQDVLRADTVDVYFKDSKLKRVDLTGQAVAISPVDSIMPEPANILIGREMQITFMEGELDSIVVRGNASSFYYIREDGENKGINQVSGDLIKMWIAEDRIRWIYVEGGTEGIYYPPHLENQARGLAAGISAEGRTP